MKIMKKLNFLAVFCFAISSVGAIAINDEGFLKLVDYHSISQQGLDNLLVLASKMGYENSVNLLLAKGANVNGRSSKGEILGFPITINETPLYHAIKHKHPVIAMILIKAGATDATNPSHATNPENPENIYQKEISNTDLLEKRFLNAFREQLEKNPQVPQDFIDNVLAIALFSDFENLAKEALLKGASIKNLSPNFGYYYRNPNIVKMLLDAGLDPNHQDSSGETPLHTAVRNNDSKIVKMLLDAGADKDIKSKGYIDDKGKAHGFRSPLDIAKVYKNPEVLKLLDPNYGKSSFSWLW